MKKSIILLAFITISVYCFSQKAAITYQYSFPNGAPVGLAAHFYIPKTSIGVWGDINYKPVRKGFFDNKSGLFVSDNNSSLPQGFTITEEGNTTYTSMHIGVSFLTEYKIHLDAGIGIYFFQDYREAQNNNDGSTTLFINQTKTIPSYRFGVAAQAGKYIRLATNFDFAMDADKVYAFRFVFGLGYFIH